MEIIVFCFFGGKGIKHLLLPGPPSAQGPWLHPSLPTGLKHMQKQAMQIYI